MPIFCISGLLGKPSKPKLMYCHVTTESLGIFASNMNRIARDDNYQVGLLSICTATVTICRGQNSPRGCKKGHPWLLALEWGIGASSVHDAVAVTQDNADWAKEAMLRAS